MLCQGVVGVAELTPTPVAPADAKNVSPLQVLLGKWILWVVVL